MLSNYNLNNCYRIKNLPVQFSASLVLNNKNALHYLFYKLNLIKLRKQQKTKINILSFLTIVKKKKKQSFLISLPLKLNFYNKLDFVFLMVDFGRIWSKLRQINDYLFLELKDSFNFEILTSKKKFDKNIFGSNGLTNSLDAISNVVTAPNNSAININHFHVFDFFSDNSIKFKYTQNLFKFFQDLRWFFFCVQNIKELLFFILKSCFFEFIFRYSDLRNKVTLFFYETSDLKFLTASLISTYLIRNLRIGNKLIRIISPLLNHLKKSNFIYQGWKIGCFGRFQRRGRAQHLWFGKGGVPLNTVISCVDFFKSVVRLRNGLCCVKIFILRSNIYIYLF